MSSGFYDNFISYQIHSGINDRIYSLYKRIRKFGISNKKILEIGCGIGALTYLLSKKIKGGKVEAFDPSEKSIEYAQKYIPNQNIILKSSDVLSFTPQFAPYDFILIFDVLEHIPEANHFEVFKQFKLWMNNESVLLINLPNPSYIIYDQKNQPEELQQLDQPILLENLLSIFTKLGLELKYFETYSVWVKEDYQFLIVQNKKEFIEQQLSSERTFFQKAVIRIKRDWRKLKYRLPK